MADITIQMDYPTVVQMIRAGEQRIAVFEQHVTNGVPREDLAFAIEATGRGVRALRVAAGLVDLDYVLQGGLPIYEPLPDIPLASWSETELRAAWGDR